MDTSKLKVILSGVPKTCKLRVIKAEILETIKASAYDITTIRKCKYPNGEIIPGKLEVEFTSTEYVEELLKKAVLEVEFDDQLSTIRITRCRPTVTSVPSESQLNFTSSSSPSPVYMEEKRDLPESFSTCPKLPIASEMDMQATTDADDVESDASTDDEFEKVGFGRSKSNQSHLQQAMPQRNSRSFMPSGSLGLKDDSDSFSPSSSRRQQHQVLVPQKKTTFFDLLQDEPDIFETYKDNGVLVQVDSNDSSEVRQASEYFGTLPGLRPIKTALLDDGLLLIYESSKIASDVVQKSHTINNDSFEVVRKPIPSVYTDRILFKGNFTKNTTEEVKEIIETCCGVPFKVKKLRECGMFLVVFRGNVDVKLIQKHVKKLNLRILKPQVIKVCRTDCVKVQNVKENVQNYSIRLAFMNKKLTGGDVTLVERGGTKSKIAFVYYANYKDAESLIKNSKDQEVKVQQHSVEVSLYWTGIKGSVEFSANNVSQFYCPLDEIDRDIVTFVSKGPPQQISDFHKELGNLARVEIIADPETSEYSVKVKPMLTPEQSQEMEQEKFEDQCKTKIFRFFRKFKADTRRFSGEDKERVREANKWSDYECFVVQEIKKDETVKVFVRWEDKDHETVKAVGLPTHVHSFLEWFEVKCKHTEHFEEFDALNFDILMNCGIVDEMAEVFRDTIDLQIKKKTKSILLSGPRDTVGNILSTIRSVLKRTQSKDIDFLHKSQQDFLAKTLQDQARSKEIIDFIQERLKSSEIKVSLQFQGGKLKMICSPQKRDEFRRAEEELRGLIKFQLISIESGYDEIMAEEEWKKLQAKVESGGKLFILQNRLSSSITLVGLPLSFNSEFERISAYMAENVEVDQTVEMTFSHAMFFSNFARELGVEKHISESVEWFKEEGGIHLRGRARLVKKVHKWINATVKKFITQSREIVIPGLNDYLRSQSGDQFLQNTSKDNTCFIKLDSADNPKWLEARKKAHQDITEMQYERVPESFDLEQNEDSREPGFLGKLKKNVEKFFLGSDTNPTPQQVQAVKVNVIKGDILSSKCEVMINTTGSEFDLTLSRVSKALIQKSGRAMIAECANNPIVKNDILRVTMAPKLTFKYVIHLVSPHSASKISEHLLEALKTAEKLKCQSISVPAIGTGQIDLSDANVARYIRKAIDEFRKTDPTFLNQVDVVIFEARMLAAFQNALIGPSHMSNKGPKPRARKSQMASVPSTSQSTPSTSQRGNVTVVVTKGDILASNCEVLINTTGGDFNLTASLLSQKLIQKGGKAIVKECNSNPVLRSNECTVTSGGNTQFQNIVHFVTPQVHILPQNLKNVLDIINNQLKKKSVAIPAIGTGQAQLPVDQVAQAFEQAISNFIATNPTHLQRIEVVIFDQTLLQKFRSKIISGHATSTATTAPSSNVASSSVDEEPQANARISNRSRIETLETKNDRRHRVVLYFTSTSTANIGQALEAIHDKANKKCSNVKIQDAVLEMLDNDDLLDLKDIEREFNVSIKIPDDDDSENQFEIWGLRHNVMEAHKFTVSRLHKYNQAATLSDYISWKYEDPPNSDKWKSFSLLNNFELEDHFKEDPNSSEHFKIKGLKNDMFVDFGKKTMTDGKNSYKIKQVPTGSGSGNELYPTHWDKTKFRQLVPIPSSDPEYTMVVTTFRNGGLQPNTIVQLERVENKRQYTQFVAQKQDVEKRMNGKTVTKELFHGTSSNICEQIYKNGFDRNFSGKNATAFGDGVYFATTSSYSHNYTSPNQQGHRKMFLADVITGEFAQGQRGMRVPPVLSGSDLYDSVVDNVSNPTMYIVFKDASVYPLYILTYT